MPISKSGLNSETSSKPFKICSVTGSRAEFGYSQRLIEKIQADPFFELDYVVTGAHLSKQKGYTVEEIKSSNIKISKCIEIPDIDDNSRLGIVNQISETISLFARYFSENRPSLLIVVGDRYEMFGVCTAASNLLIPIAHISGGSTTSGAIDEIYRHSITKMSSLHFPTCEAYRQRVIQLGEHPDTVFNTGSLGVENCLKKELLSEDEIRKQLNLETNMPYCVVTFHPVTLEKDTAEDELYELIHSMDEFSKYSYIITLSNADSGGNKINEIWEKESLTRPNFRVVSSLGVTRYLSALKYAEMMIGNSSSGTTEGPAMRIPVIDIGDRQKGRFFADNIIHCEPNQLSITSAIKKASTDDFKEFAKTVQNPFGNGDTSDKIIEIIKQKAPYLSVKKDFYDIKNL